MRYILHKNPLINDGYSASVDSAGLADMDALVSRIVEQGSTVRRADVLAVLENAFAAAESLLKDGFRVQLGNLVELYPRIRGTFKSPADSFDPARHRLDLAAICKSRLKEGFSAGTSLSKGQMRIPAPSLTAFSQNPAPADTSVISPGSIATICGYRLKFNTSNADEGIFFVAADGLTAFRVAAVQTNTPKKLLFLTPSLAPGLYALEVRARIRGGRQLRTGRLSNTLTASS